MLGKVIFTLNRIASVISIKENMKDKQYFSKVLFLAILTIFVFLVIFGVLGYSAFGDDIQGPITLNLPLEDPFAKVSLLLYSLAVLSICPLLLFPIVDIVSPFIFNDSPITRYSFSHNLFSSFPLFFFSSFPFSFFVLKENHKKI